MFRIDKIKGVDRQEIDVSLDGKYTEKNYFSIITGENGCGKSSLLNRAVNNFVFRQANVFSDCQLTDNSISEPSRVIAICNARYSKFPKMIHVLRKNEYKPHNFYIHAEHDTEVGKSLISILGNVLRESPSKGKLYNKSGVSEAFKMIGINPIFLIDVRLNSNLLESYRRYEESELGLIEDSKISTSDNIKKLIQWEHAIDTDGINQSQLIDYLKIKSHNINSRCRVEFSAVDGEIKLKVNDNLDSQYILSAIHRGFIEPKDLQIQRTDSLKWVSYQDLSSGQLSLLINALILTTFVKKDSLICIDEPENSLHPEWQLNYMSFLSDLCPSDAGCHFLIATHSPQIISGMTSNNGCIVSLLKDNPLYQNHFRKMKRNEIGFNSFHQELYSASSYLRRSADQQLMDIFNSPGFANESIIHRLILILTKITKKAPVNSSDYEYLDEIADFIRTGRIDRFDPATMIFNQIKSIRMAR
ncbi:ATP-binding protein [Pantoea agglomerans]|uniref:ATP-binding protein n=1 Tax=Enterobacter agglomerans TaxID=549 RepID=UPI003208FF47